jgi:hypothetical protein
MSIKKLLKIASFLFVIAFAVPFSSTASVMKVPLTDSAADARLYTHLVQRVAEIQNLDITSLSATEKKELKKELLQLKKKGDGLNQRVYLSVGAIIIILLLLILIL